jgi:SNF family Na+-dependent transporter
LSNYNLNCCISDQMNSDQIEHVAVSKLERATKNKCVDFFRDKDDGGDRQRWASNTTFVLAAIGSAIGLGNFWRFPYLCYKWGGALFFIPYFISLLFLGIPMLMLEFALGQKFQRGDIGVFRGIHPRLAGIGLASVFCSYSITFYYNVIISWSLVYFFCAFISPLPWSVQNVADPSTMVRDCPGITITEE